MRSVTRPVLAVLLVLAAACGGKGDGVTDPIANLAAGSLSARVDGSTWNASTGLTASFSGSILVFAGTNNSTTIGMAVGIVNGPGTFAIGTAGAPSNAIISESSGRSWHALSTIGTGTVTITSINSTGAVGTFSFTAPPVQGSGATGSKVVTEGKFNLKF